MLIISLELSNIQKTLNRLYVSCSGIMGMLYESTILNHHNPNTVKSTYPDKSSGNIDDNNYNFRIGSDPYIFHTILSNNY